MRMQLRVLGQVEAVFDGTPVATGGPRQRAVLAVLITSANESTSMDRLISEVWGEDPPPAARNSLQSMISNLRSALKPDPDLSIDIVGKGYVLRVPPEAVDAIDFAMKVDSGRRLLASEPASSRRHLRSALDLWRGDAYSDVADESALLRTEAVRLGELRLRALEYRIEADLALGLAGELVGELEALVHLHPLREGLYRLLMLSLYRSQRQAEALRTLSRLRQVLADELGIDPSADLVQLEQQILDQSVDEPEVTSLAAGETVIPSVRGYELRQRVGEGRLGVVYRAYQHSMGREVAVRVVPASVANHPDFIRSFDQDAQRVARLDHPHIVALLDYWREPDAAYLVYRWVEGAVNIDDVDQRWEAGTVGRIVAEVGDALTYARRRGGDPRRRLCQQRAGRCRQCRSGIRFRSRDGISEWRRVGIR